MTDLTQERLWSEDARWRAVLHFEVEQFLVGEAALLDDHRYTAWLSLLTDDVSYQMPVQVTAMRGQSHSSTGEMDHFAEDRYSLGKRVERLMGSHAWTEDPPSRTRRFVTNVRVVDGPGAVPVATQGGLPVGADGTASSTACRELHVCSYLLLFRSRLDVRPPEWVSAERRDVLRRVEGSFRIARRLVTVDEAVLRTQNLAVFL